MSEAGIEISLIDLFTEVKSKVRFILLFLVIAIIISLVHGFTSPKEYQVDSSFMLNNMGQSGSPSSLNGLAGLAGISLGDFSEEEFTPDLISELIHTTSFQMELLETEFSLANGDKKSLKTFYDEDVKSNMFEKILYGISSIRKIFRKKSKGNGQDSNLGYYNLSMEESDLVQRSSESMVMSFDEDRKLYSLSVQLQDPLLCAQVSDYIVTYLLDFLEHNKDQKNTNKLKFIKTQLDEKSSELRIIRRKIYEFEDSHKKVVKATADTEKDALMDDYSLIFNIYTVLRQQEEEIQLSIEENKISYNWIEKIKIPNLPISPKKVVVLFIGMIIGIIVPITIILLKFIYRNSFYVK